MMNKQAMTGELERIIAHARSLETRLQTLLREQNIRLSDAPYGVASGLTRLEDFCEDIQNAIDELRLK